MNCYVQRRRSVSVVGRGLLVMVLILALVGEGFTHQRQSVISPAVANAYPRTLQGSGLLSENQTVSGESADECTAAADRKPRKNRSVTCLEWISDPFELNRVWKGLSRKQRDEVYLHDINVGNRNGIPVTDRHYYNMRHLYAEKQRNPDSYGNLSEAIHRIGPKKYLMVFKPDEGKTAIAINNPDQAHDVATFIPGSNTTIDKMSGQVERAQILTRVSESSGGRLTSVIVWLDYDVPHYVQALSMGRANDAAGPVNDFQRGLRASHTGRRSHNTVLGHSYGGLVVSSACQGGYSLDADDIVFVAASGTGGNRHIYDLKFTNAKPGPADYVSNDRHVFAMQSPSDWLIRSNLFHGTDPSNPRFGAVQLHTDDHGDHYGYFSSNPGLRNLARVIAGNYRKINEP